jgi:hypothetical protein
VLTTLSKSQWPLRAPSLRNKNQNHSWRQVYTSGTRRSVKKPDEDGSGSDELAGEPVFWKVVSSAECFIEKKERSL